MDYFHHFLRTIPGVLAANNDSRKQTTATWNETQHQSAQMEEEIHPDLWICIKGAFLADFSVQGGYPLVDCPTQLTLMTWICQLSRRWDPSKGGSKMFGASLRPGKDIWRRFLCKIYMVCPYKLVTCKQNASKKVQNLLKTAVSAGRQSHPRNEEQACSKSHMDFSGSDLHISH